MDRGRNLRELVRSSDGRGTDAEERTDPASVQTGDAPGYWDDPDGPVPIEPLVTDEDDLVSEPVPEADSAETTRAWEATEAMEGQAPTG